MNKFDYAKLTTARHLLKLAHHTIISIIVRIIYRRLFGVVFRLVRSLSLDLSYCAHSLSLSHSSVLSIGQCLYEAISVFAFVCMCILCVCVFNSAAIVAHHPYFTIRRLRRRPGESFFSSSSPISKRTLQPTHSSFHYFNLFTFHT